MELRINDEGVSLARHYNSSILKRLSISGQALGLPDSLHGVVGEDTERVNSLGIWYLLFNDVRNPLSSPKTLSIGRMERSDVRDEGGSNQSVSNHCDLIGLESLNVFGPTDVFVGETIN